MLRISKWSAINHIRVLHNEPYTSTVQFLMDFQDKLGTVISKKEPIHISDNDNPKISNASKLTREELEKLVSESRNDSGTVRIWFWWDEYLCMLRITEPEPGNVENNFIIFFSQSINDDGNYRIYVDIPQKMVLLAKIYNALFVRAFHEENDDEGEIIGAESRNLELIYIGTIMVINNRIMTDNICSELEAKHRGLYLDMGDYVLFVSYADAIFCDLIEYIKESNSMVKFKLY